MPAVPPKVEARFFAGLIITGTVGARYEVQSTPAVGPANWTVMTNFHLPSSPYVFIDYNSPTNAQLFYQVVPVSP